MKCRFLPNFLGLGFGVERTAMVTKHGGQPYDGLHWKVFLGPFVIYGTTDIDRPEPIANPRKDKRHATE